jgi:hypothetical protein
MPGLFAKGNFSLSRKEMVKTIRDNNGDDGYGTRKALILKDAHANPGGSWMLKIDYHGWDHNLKIWSCEYRLFHKRRKTRAHKP